MTKTDQNRVSTGMATLSDSELWAQIMDGNQPAWRQLIERFQPLVYAVTTRSGLSVADAADCFQQTWVSLYTNRHRINEPSRLSAWLVTTAKREVLRVLRRQKGLGGLSEIDEPADSSPLPDQVLADLESQAALERGLKVLDERCRKLLTALFFSGEKQSYEEISQVAGIPFNSLGPIRGRCLERLKKILLENGFSPVRDE